MLIPVDIGTVNSIKSLKVDQLLIDLKDGQRKPYEMSLLLFAKFKTHFVHWITIGWVSEDTRETDATEW